MDEALVGTTNNRDYPKSSNLVRSLKNEPVSILNMLEHALFMNLLRLLGLTQQGEGFIPLK